MFFPSPVTYSLKLLKCYVGPSRQFKRPSQNSKPFNYHQHTSDQKPINKTNFLNSSAQPIFYIIPLDKPNSCVHLDRSQGCGSIFENKKHLVLHPGRRQQIYFTTATHICRRRPIIICITSICLFPNKLNFRVHGSRGAPLAPLVNG